MVSVAEYVGHTCRLGVYAAVGWIRTFIPL